MSTMKFTSVSAVMLLCYSLCEAQSFDCKKASTEIERSICSSVELSRLDVALAADFSRALRTAPVLKDALTNQQREWIAARDAKCRLTGSGAPQVKCLADMYSARMAQFSSGTAKAEAASFMTASCETAVERFRALPLQSGKSPLRALTEAKQTGVTVTPEVAALGRGVPDLIAWAANQTPAIELPEGLKDDPALVPHGSNIALARLPGTEFFAVHSQSGTMHCYSSTYFEVERGKARIASAPPGFWDEEDSGCMVDRSFGTIDQKPVMFEEYYTYGPQMTSTLTIATWEDDRFAAACRVTFEFEPEFADGTLNDWGETLNDPTGCSGEHCDRLREAAYHIVAAVQEDPDVARSQFASRLAKAEALTYSQVEQAESAQATTRAAANPDSITKERPFRVPYVDADRVYVVSVGHFTIGWRYFADWSVTFQEVVDDQLIERATFVIGMWKGNLKSTNIEPR